MSTRGHIIAPVPPTLTPLLTEERRERWISLAARLLVVAPERWDEVVHRVSAIVEASELIGSACHPWARAALRVAGRAQA